jgi:glycosyltransferase involved in cell wall biosynthesis
VKVDYPIYVYPPRVLQSSSDRFMELSSRRAVRRAMAELRPDCVLSYWVHPDGAVAARIAREAGIPSAVIVGGSDVLVLGRQGGRRQRAVVRALHANDAIITVGRDLAHVVERLGVPSRKVHVVYQGVETDVFAPGSQSDARKRLGIPDDVQVLVAVGSLLPVKGIDVLLEAMARLRSRCSGVRLYLVGDGASRAELEVQALRLGLEQTVHFVGKVTQQELPDWYRAADLTVLASRSEGVPNVLRETMACGTPFVATRVGGVHEIAAGTTNRLVPAEDAPALADAIAAALAERTQGTSDARATRPASLMTWKESTQQIVDVFQTLLSALP